jgi:hypothetical protein
MKNYEQIMEVAGKRSDEFRERAKTSLDEEYRKFQSGEESRFTGDEIRALTVKMMENNAMLSDMSSLDNVASVLRGEYSQEVRDEYIRKFIANYYDDLGSPEHLRDERYAKGVELVAEFFDIAGGREFTQIQSEIRSAHKLATMAERSINPTPFDEKDFQKQLMGTVLKAMLDKGYKKISFPRPWAEEGSRNTELVTWREVEVPPYVDEDGVTQTTAFIVSKTRKEGLYRETDLNKRSMEATAKLHENITEDQLTRLRETGEWGGTEGYLFRKPEDALGKRAMEDIAAGIASPDTKNMARAVKKMLDSRKGYDSIKDYDPLSQKEWFNTNAEFLQLQGYITNYQNKLPKDLLKVVQEFDPTAQIQKGQQKLLYERESMANIFSTDRMYPLGDAKGIVENPYFGKDVKEIIDSWNLSEEFLRLSSLDTSKVYTLTKLKYLPQFTDSIPNDPAVLYYIPEERYRRLFTNKSAAEKIVREFNTYDVEWIDLSPMYDTVDGKPVKRTDGGVSVLGLVPAAAVPAYLMGTGGEAEAAEVDINRETDKIKMPPPEKPKPERIGK